MRSAPMGRDALVLCYHALSDRWPAALSTTPGRFEAQISLLARRGYRGVTFLDAARGSDAGRAVAITFDDAYRSVLELARPILDRFGMPATVFVSTAFAGAQSPMSWEGIDRWLSTEHSGELMPMSWDELGQLVEAGWEIGSHTRTHARLTALDDRALDEELVGSREDLRRALGLTCRSLAYPYGDHDRRVVERTRAAGYEAAGTLPARLPRGNDPHAYPRIGIYRRDDGWRFRLKVSPPLRRVRAGRVWGLLDAARRVSRAPARSRQGARREGA
jgi:peptidoglycan/xylan/chitin deacetylase (PgdA/CDA1 family)